MITLLWIACMHPAAPPEAAADAPSVDVQPEIAPVLPGSMWSEVYARQLIGMDGNARRVGDLITVVIDEASATSLGADTSTSRSTSADYHLDALLGLEASIMGANPNMGGKIALGGGSDTSSVGTGSTARSGSLTATVTCQVVGVLPNGNLRIRGTKQIRVNRETQYLALEGTIRPRDILLDNTVRSDLIADSHIEFTGAGVLAKDQGAGRATGLANAIWPF